MRCLRYCVALIAQNLNRPKLHYGLPDSILFPCDFFQLLRFVDYISTNFGTGTWIGGQVKVINNLNLNRVMRILTVITALFMPLTLIVGRYGMNFVHMPELSIPWAYPALPGVFAAVIAGLVIVFRRNKLM
ncbi:MAG: CorA family divalent cation transporter [Eubacteriales bacterium]|nr:CorA family divalent cation transporter [Eubacteriales bacterium]